MFRMTAPSHYLLDKEVVENMKPRQDHRYCSSKYSKRRELAGHQLMEDFVSMNSHLLFRPFDHHKLIGNMKTTNPPF